MDKFFKLVNSGVDPKCNEANEYLAEDRVMCLQIYIKKNAGFYLKYIPDAKAFTDAPPNLTTLIKQRRRWNNGALFAALRVINNIFTMISCSRTKHHPIRQIGMAFFLLYFFTMQILSFFLVGMYYASVKVFYSSFFSQLTDKPGYQ